MKKNKKTFNNTMFCLFVSTEDLNFIIKLYQNVIKKFLNEHGHFTIINFKRTKKIYLKNSYLNLKSSKVKICEINKKEKFLSLINNKKVIGIDAVPKKIKYFKERTMLNQSNIFLIYIMNSGSLSNEVSFNNQVLTSKKIYFKIKTFLAKFIFRILILINIFPKTYLYFESRRKIVNKFNNNFIRKIVNKFSFFGFLLNYKKIILLNSNAFENFKNSKIKKKENFILFLDGNYNHKDVLEREGKKILKNQKKYLNYLSNYLNLISKIYKKKVEIALHPSSNLKKYKKLFPDFKISKGKTDVKIYKSSLVIFHESSSVIDAIILKKKILLFQTKILGEYLFNRINYFKTNFHIPSINIDEIKDLKFVNSSIIKKKLNIKNNYLKKYIYDNLIVDGHTIPSDKIIKYVNNFISNSDEK
jgi:hypothetical protein